MDLRDKFDNKSIHLGNASREGENIAKPPAKCTAHAAFGLAGKVEKLLEMNREILKDNKELKEQIRLLPSSCAENRRRTPHTN